MADANLAWQITEQVTRLRQRQTGPLILELDLTEGLPEGPVTDPLSAIMARRKTQLPDILEGLRRARQDDRVRALVAKVGGARIGLARMQEIREAVSRFRESGKLTVAWAETFGEFTGGNVPYYLATAFDRIYLQPSGSVGVTGVAVEHLFLHDASAAARPPTTPGRCSTAVRSWPRKHWPRAWSMSSATGTRCTRRSARRRARTRPCSTWRATSELTCSPSGPASCRIPASVSSP